MIVHGKITKYKYKLQLTAVKLFNPGEEVILDTSLPANTFIVQEDEDASSGDERP